MRLMHSVRALTLSSLLFAGSAFSATIDTPPAATVTAAQRAATLAAICAKTACRKTAQDIRLRLSEDGKGYGFKTSLYPYVDDDGVVILYPGDIITVTFARNGDVLGKPRLVSVEDANGPVKLDATASSRAGTLTFRLSQNKDDAGMELVVTNTLDATIKYGAQITVPASGGVRSGRTSICPLFAPQKPAASFAGHETWPHPIAMMVITDIRAIPKGGALTCD